MTRQFDFATPEQFPELVELVSGLMTRKIGDVHLHHTVLPDQAFYDDLAGPHDRNGEAAGREICERLWTSHVERHGWHDIAQHVTIDPAGRIWKGRDWNLPPASAAGHNGNATRGPFMLALVGNFDAGAGPTAAQLAATATVVAAVQRAFGLAPAAFSFHCDLDGQRTCPGALDRDALLKAVTALHQRAPGPSTRGPLGKNQREVYRLLYGRRDLNGGGERAERPLGDEAPGCLPGAVPDSGLTARRTRGAAARGGGSDDEAITPEMFRMLKPHVIHLRSGRFEDDGPFATTRSDAEGLVASIVRWARGLRGDATPRVLIWAHGGLAPLDRALAYAWRYHRWWLANDIYPVFFVWETGAIETALQIVEAQLGPRPRGVPWDDWVVESLVHGVGRPFWRQMKTSAENAGMAGRDRGAAVLAELLAAQAAQAGAPKLELHVVGHSAGAIFHGHFLHAARAKGVAVKSLTFLAPACTVGLFERFVQPHVASGAVERFRVFALDRGREIADPTVPVYDKSLLYLVSRGFEERRGEPILGLEESIRQDDGLIRLFGLAGGTPQATLVFCPTPDGTPDIEASGATVHGGFQQDEKTLRAVRADILGGDLSAAAPPPPSPPAERGGERLYRSFRDTYPYAFAAVPAAGSAIRPTAQAPTASVAAQPAAGGARRALSVAINEYGGQYQLGACVEDSRLWTALFRDMGFEVATLHDREATRTRVTAAIETLLNSARPGDVLALHYSGHGTRFPDLDGDEEEDGKDDALVPIDGLSDNGYLIDDDIHLLFDRLNPQVDFTFFADCCHSGTISRFTVGRKEVPGVKSRFIRATPEMIASYTTARGGMRATRTVANGGEDAMTHILVSACREAQTAKESDGNGWFSRVATQVIREAGEPISNRELVRRVEEQFGRLGYSDNDQTPQIQGRTAAKDRPILGGLVYPRR